MPNVQQKKFNSGAIIALVFLVLMVGVLFIKAIPFWGRIAAEAVLLLLFLFIRRGYLYMFSGIQAINKKKQPEQAWPKFERALKAGVDEERRLVIGSAFVQYGDPQRGVDILEGVRARTRNEGFRNTAIITASMGYWRLGNYSKAISDLDELRKAGLRDINLSINLETYLLETGDLRKAKEVIRDSRKGGEPEGNGLLDNRGWYYIQTGDWKKASEVYDELIDDRNAKFPEAYLHGAQVSVHENRIAEAVDRLGWGLSKNFSSTCLASKEYFETLMLGLENPATRAAFAKAMDSACVAVSRCQKFDGMELATAFDVSATEGALVPKAKPESTPKAPSLKETVRDLKEQALSEYDMNTDIDDDDRIPNTDLDEEDEELAAEYGQGTEPDCEDLPNTGIDDSDDDDRIPNTDLDDDE